MGYFRQTRKKQGTEDTGFGLKLAATLFPTPCETHKKNFGCAQLRFSNLHPKTLSVLQGFIQFNLFGCFELIIHPNFIFCLTII